MSARSPCGACPKARPESWTPCFRTDDQAAWLKRLSRANEYLREIGVTTRLGSRFDSDPVGLANAIRRGLGEPED